MAGSNGRAKRHFFGGTGLYIALFLGVTALAVAGYWTLLPKNTTDKDAENVSSQVELPVQDETPQMPEAELPQEAAKPAEPVEEPPEDLTVMDEATGVEDTVPAMESETDAQPVAPRLVVAPLVGEEVAAFSVDELTYNETLGDWRTHDGIDIAAEVGTQVIAACSGVVTAVPIMSSSRTTTGTRRRTPISAARRASARGSMSPRARSSARWAAARSPSSRCRRICTFRSAKMGYPATQQNF